MSSPKIISGKAYRRILVPGVFLAAVIFLLVVALVLIVEQNSLRQNILFYISVAGSSYGLLVALFRYPTWENESWVHVVLVGISLGIFASLVPDYIFFTIYILYVLNMISAVLSFSVVQIHTMVAIAFLFHLYGYAQLNKLADLRDWLFLLSLPSLSLVVAEIVHRLQKTINDNFMQIEMINKISRKLSSSLDENEVHTWFKEAIQNVFDADTYYLALVNGDYLDLGLFYDDGKYYHAVHLPLEGTLGGWTIKNQQTLFLNDLRVEPQLDGVKTRLVGKEKASLSWLGVPFQTEHVTGLTGIASYDPLAFTQRDVELLESLTQQAALALNNARQHKLVVKQTRIDSLTQVYNHGYFLERLSEDIFMAQADNVPLSIIMLDVDFFKKYNDMYGHLVGDEVLMLMVKTIKRFIKERDSIGRWGGEEFVISLPKTSLEEAKLVAKRIQETLETMHVSVLTHRDIPVPTVSQGIAEYPREADKLFELVDLADQRLYIAKERGRNQIEP